MKSVIVGVSIILVFLFVSGFALFFLPCPPLLEDVSFSKALYAENGELLRLTLSRDEKYRLFTPLSQISPKIVDSSLLQEDQYYQWHIGINPYSLLKAFWQTYIIKSRRMGGSTITMQVARMRFGIRSKKISGKVLQMLRALQLEMHYSKQQILEAYLNLAPYGNNIEGVGAASLIYFSKPAKQLLLPEALTLSVMPQNPTQRIAAKPLKITREKLFQRWIKLHPEDRDKKFVLALPLQMQSLHRLPYFAPHFVNTVLANAAPELHELHTTLHFNLQKHLQNIVQHYLLQKKNNGVYNAAVLLVDTRDMGVKVMIGSADFFNSTIQGQINGTEVKRSPGSTLKPFIYGLALDQGLIHPATVLKDVPHSFGSYNPENFDYDFMGPLTATEALVLSRNIPAINLANQLKNPNLYQFLENAEVSNLKSESYYGLALVLGGAELSMQELVSLYAMLVNDGRWSPIHFLQDPPSIRHKRLLSAEASFLVLDMLKNTPQPETIIFSSRQMPQISWKTGTSSGYRDAWTIGTWGPYVLAVWVGNFNNSGNPAFVGKTIAAPLFFELASAIQHEMPLLPSINKHPYDLHLTRIPICKVSGMLPSRYCRDTQLTWFIPGKSPIQADNIYREIPIDSKTGLRTCHFNQDTRFEIYEFWPSDLLKIFKQAGMQRRTPPVFEANCPLVNDGLAPHITSPQLASSYIMKTHVVSPNRIPFTAVVDADVHTLFWFINETYLGKTMRDEPYLWLAKSGKFIIRVLDDHGRADARELTVMMEG